MASEACFVADLDPVELKRLTVELEETCEFGRLFDMDVLDSSGEKLDRASLGLEERRCLIRGGHSDMDFFTFLNSTAALWPFLEECAQVVATGSCFGNTLRRFTVSGDHQGEGLLNQIVTHLISVQLERGNVGLFLYTKLSTARFFPDLGFYEIARVDDTLVFMENRRNGFANYLKALARQNGRPSAAIVMNANPFTLGHQYLVEQAAAQWDRVHLFLVSAEATSLLERIRLAGEVVHY